MAPAATGKIRATSGMRGSKLISRSRGRKRVFDDKQAPARWIAHISVVAIIGCDAMRAVDCLDGRENRRRAFRRDPDYRHRGAFLPRQIDVRETGIVSDNVHSSPRPGTPQFTSLTQLQHVQFPFVASSEKKSATWIRRDSS